MRKKITCEPLNVSVRDVINDYSEKKMAVVKSFQRRQVWDKKTINEYIESVSEGTAVSGIIVADIESGIVASETFGDESGKKRYLMLYSKDYRTINEDGQNRLFSGIMAFCNNEVTFTGTLYDLNYKPGQFINIKFEKLPERFQHAFMTSSVVVVRIKNAPFSKLPGIFRKLNSGMPLNRTEMRQSIQTPISDWIRDYCEGTFKEMWPRFTGCGANAILRMRDIEWMTQSFMILNKHTKSRFFRDDDMDWFFNVGENRPMGMVEQYDKAQRQRAISILEIVRSTVEVQQTVPESKRIPQRTYWALLTIAEYIYNSAGKYTIHSYDQFYKDIYSIDSQLVTNSKIQQANDLNNLRISSPHLDDDEIRDALPDRNYYWNQCRRMEVPFARNLRQKALIDVVSKKIKAGQFSSVVVRTRDVQSAAK
jgi:hypothetical protein